MGKHFTRYVLVFLIAVIMLPCGVAAQSIKVLTTNAKTSLRGLYAVDNKVVWVCGSNGMVGKTGDGGKSWRWKRIPRFENTDFRDIKAFDINVALIMATGEPGAILRTDDGGDHWKQVYLNETPGIFLDAMSFWDSQLGIVIGDPINNKFVVARTFDGGETWHDLPHEFYPEAMPGEALFAASGTNIKCAGGVTYFITGGMKSRLFIGGGTVDIPIAQGSTTTGANSIGMTKKEGTLVIVGGDYTNASNTDKNCCFSTDGGTTWRNPATPPGGYRSCVEYINKNTWITCGLNGVDISKDNGNTWRSISGDSYNVCAKAKKGSKVFLASSNGTIGLLMSK